MYALGKMCFFQDDASQKNVQDCLNAASSAVEVAQEALKQATGSSARGVVTELLSQCEECVATCLAVIN